jgi:hypothetical protein
VGSLVPLPLRFIQGGVVRVLRVEHSLFDADITGDSVPLLKEHMGGEETG